MQADIQRTTCDVGFMPYPVWVMHVSVQLSYRRIRRYLVLPPKEAEKHVTSSHVRFTNLDRILDLMDEYIDLKEATITE